jgi:hypothetical protein
MALRSPRVPAAGIVLVWGFYACFRVLVPTAPEEPANVDETSRRAAVLEPNVAPPVRSSKRGEVRAQEAAAPIEGAPAEASDAKPELSFRLDAADAALLDILFSGFDPKDLSRLKEFVDEHPEHALGRALLIAYLFNDDGADADELRSHVEALQALKPEFGLPDFFMAYLEGRAGREDLARQLLLDAAGKDLSWLPVSEVLRLKISSDLAAGKQPLAVLRDAFSMDMAPSAVARDAARSFLPKPEEGKALDASAASRERRAEMARALFRFGAAMQEHGVPIIENLVGTAIASSCREDLERGGTITAEESAVLRRGEATLGEARVTANVIQELLVAHPGFLREYVENLARYGELRASRRAFMDYYAAARGR